MIGPVTASGRDLRALAGIIRADRGEPPAEGVAPSLLTGISEVALFNRKRLESVGIDRRQFGRACVEQIGFGQLGDQRRLAPSAAGGLVGQFGRGCQIDRDGRPGDFVGREAQLHECPSRQGHQG